MHVPLAVDPETTRRRFSRIKETRKYWLLPLVVLIILVGLFINLFTGHNVQPAIYNLIP